jgi:uncharacterized protein YdaT
MAKFKALKTFRDIHTKEIYKEGAVIEMAVKRADEVKKNLDDTFLERVEEKDDQDNQDDPEGAK